MPLTAEHDKPTFQVAIDTGGTFTDVAVRRPDGSIFVWKVSSTPAAPDDGVIDGLTGALAELGTPPSSVDHFVHGTTVATNTVITRTGARVGLVTTRGFADLLEIANQTRPSLYDPTVRRTRPLVPGEAVWEVDERIGSDGSRIHPLDTQQLATLVEQIRAADLDVVVVSLINAYACPDHEVAVAEFFERENVAPSVFAATTITAEMREYERTSTAVLNGYVQPKIAGYIDRLAGRTRDSGLQCGMWVMQSNGGLLSPQTAQRESARTVLSGLAGGVVGAAGWARQLDLPNVVSFDIGGTSTDIALIRDGRPVEAMSGEIDDLPLRMPMVDVHTIGAGGGSIAWTDSGDSLRIGPHSAGAVPGPVCYSRGGTDLTVTDAHAVLGRLGATLLGGRLALDVAAARERMGELADKIGLSMADTAAGILRVINANMARGVRKVSVERGVDLRDCTLMAFGGAGPLHGGDLVAELAMKSAVIPPMPGIASAVGMLDAPLRHDFSANAFAQGQHQIDDLSAVLGALRQEAVEAVGGRNDVIYTPLVDARYVGQSYELTIAFTADFDAMRKAFDLEHQERYGFDDRDADFEVVTARITAVEDTSGRVRGSSEHFRYRGRPSPIADRPVYFDGAWTDTPVYRRDDLSDTVDIHGPMIIEQFDSTIVVTPSQRCRTDQFGFLHIYSKDQV